MRLAIYGSISTILATSVVVSAFAQRANFYSACVYLSKSSACMMILLNMGLFLSIIIGKALQAIFFGRLRAIEVEHLYERSWYAVTETCLAMTIFREEFDLQFVVIFTTLLFLKIFHWLCQDRVEFMEQAPSNRMVFHIRIVNLMIILFILDYSLANHAIFSTIEKGPSMLIMFGFEYTIMICTILSIMCKYALNVIDLRSEEPWEGKSMYVFFVDLITDFLKLITYMVFFVIVCMHYQLPLHIVRDVYVTFRSFIQRCRDLYRYRRATRNMDQLYPNATEEELSQMSDSTCIICREDMHQAHNNATEENVMQQQQRENSDQPKKLPCGHVFHFHCLRSWLERQQTCPTCRRSVLSDNSNTNTNSNAQVNGNQQEQPDFQRPIPPDQYHELLNQLQGRLQDEIRNQQNGNSSDHPTQERSADNHNDSTPILNESSQQQQQQQQPQPQLPTFGLQNSFQNSFGIFSPATNNNNNQASSVQQIHIPGMIPLAPLGLSTQHINSLPSELTPEQIDVLSKETRESIEERLRVLDTVQTQIFHSMQLLASTLSVLPSSSSQQQQEEDEVIVVNNDESNDIAKSNNFEFINSSITTTSAESSSSTATSKGNISNEQEGSTLISRKEKGKMRTNEDV